MLPLLSDELYDRFDHHLSTRPARCQNHPPYTTRPHPAMNHPLITFRFGTGMHWRGFFIAAPSFGWIFGTQFATKVRSRIVPVPSCFGPPPPPTTTSLARGRSIN